MERIVEEFAKNDTFFTEVYEVVSTVEVVLKGTNRLRIEIHKQYLYDGDTRYTATYFQKEPVYLQPSFPSKEGGSQLRTFERAPEDIAVWKAADYPWVIEQTAEAALSRVLHWVEEHNHGH